ncbi:MAG: nucleotidyl transferase AbiEii/AbiGii toxin family protein [Acidimicrobiales bacterium]
MSAAFLRESLDDLDALCGAAAEALGIPDPAFVEKDFWVVELLRSLVQPLALEPIDGKVASAEVLFKGGTSLSKAFGLVDRFSEDVDILVVCQGLGRRATEKRILRPLCERAREDLGLDDQALDWLDYETGRTRNVLYRYPRRLSSPAARPEVKLEMGVRGGTLPGTVERTVHSYVAEYVERHGIEADFVDLAAVAVSVIAPVRTLAEKLALLHHAGMMAASGDDRMLMASGRHFYDLERLLSDDSVIRSLTDATTMAMIAADVEQNSQRHGWASTARPSTGYGSSVLFDPAGPVYERAAAAYEDALALVWGARPTFDDCLRAVTDHAALL